MAGVLSIDENPKFTVQNFFKSLDAPHHLFGVNCCAFMNPLTTDDSNNNATLTQTLQAIMQQLTGINNALQAQDRRLGQLETTRDPPATASTQPETSQTGGEARGTPSQERSAPGATNREMDDLIQRLLRDNDRKETPVYQQFLLTEKGK